MNELERINFAINKGFTYDSETGNIFTKNGKLYKGSNNNGYIYMAIYIGNKQYRILGHRFAWYYMYKELPLLIDHINCNKSDNRILNLRSLTIQENGYNRLNFKGYYFNKITNKFQAYIFINNKLKHLGCFEDENDAKEAHLKARKKYYIIKN